MADGSAGMSDGQAALSKFGIVTVAVVGFTIQPVLAIADPVALLITGFLLIMVALGLAVSSLHGELPKIWDIALEVITVGTAIAMVATAGDAYLDQRSVKATCSRLQNIMLFEHRYRKDVPEIFRSLGCKIQG